MSNPSESKRCEMCADELSEILDLFSRDPDINDYLGPDELDELGNAMDILYDTAMFLGQDGR